MISMLIITLAAALLVAIFLSDKRSFQRHAYLGGLIIAQVGTTVAVIDFDIKPYAPEEANLSAIWLHAYLLTGPLVYFYTYALSGFKELLLWKKLAHCLPWVIVSASFLFFPPAVNSKWPHNWWKQIEIGPIPELMTPIILVVVYTVSVGIYCWLSLRAINFCTKSPQQEYSNSAAISLTWLKILCFLILLQAVVGLFSLVVAPFIGITPFLAFSIQELAVVSSLIILLPTVFYGFRQPAVFHPELCNDFIFHRQQLEAQKGRLVSDKLTIKTEQVNKIEEWPSPRQCNREERIPDVKASMLFDRCNSVLADQNLFLNPNFKLAGLAEALNISPNDVSYVINNCAKQNFHEYLNRFRIDYAKSFAKERARMGIPTKPTDMAYESGFNSSSTFYKHFKSFTGTTPSAFINQLSGEVKQRGVH